MKWEALVKRDALIDNISVLRQVMIISDKEDDTAYVLNQLFLQQRCGLRTQLAVPRSRNDVRTPANIAKALLIRRNLVIFMKKEFPKLNDVIAPYLDDTYLLDAYGIDTEGQRVRPAREDDAQDDDDSDDMEPDTSRLTSEESRRTLASYLKKLYAGKFEVAFCKMARDDKFSVTHLDLAHPDAAGMKKRFQLIRTH